MEELLQQFNRTFANLPISERVKPIYIDQNYGAMSWLVVKLEAENDTKIGRYALQFLKIQHFI